jgi:LPXTG-motif cell wall-anchored protein
MRTTCRMSATLDLNPRAIWQKPVLPSPPITCARGRDARERCRSLHRALSLFGNARNGGFMRIKRRRLFAAAVAGALTLGAIGIAPTAAAEGGGITGSVSVVLDFSGPDGLGHATLVATNLSDVPAWGAAKVVYPDGSSKAWSRDKFAPGQTRTYETDLPCNCEQAGAVTATAWGFSSAADRTPDWTSGPITIVDPRVTVIGCTPKPTPEPTATPTPTPTPTTTPTPTPTPTPTTSPTPSTTPTPTSTAVAAPAGTAPPTVGGLASTGIAGWSLGIVGAVAVAAIGAGLFFLLKRRRA